MVWFVFRLAGCSRGPAACSPEVMVLACGRAWQCGPSPPPAILSGCELLPGGADVRCHHLSCTPAPGAAPLPPHTTGPSSRSRLPPALPGLLSALCSQALCVPSAPWRAGSRDTFTALPGQLHITQDKWGWHGQGTYEGWGEGPQRDRDAHKVTGCRAVHVADSLWTPLCVSFSLEARDC